MIIIIFTIFTRLNSNEEVDSFEKTDMYNFIEKDFEVISFKIEKDILYLHLSNQEDDLIKMINLNNGRTIKNLYLKND